MRQGNSSLLAYSILLVGQDGTKISFRRPDCYTGSRMIIYTIGHSTRPLKELVDLLKSQSVTQLVDIRTIPRSRHNPQYEQTALQAELPKQGLTYRYIKQLGGLRSGDKDSPNMGWHNKSFRNYADYMQTDDFRAGLDELMELAKDETVAIMCAEAVPWRCHRSLVGDALLVREVEVNDIMSATSIKPHSLTSFAQVDGLTITYPGDE